MASLKTISILHFINHLMLLRILLLITIATPAFAQAPAQTPTPAPTPAPKRTLFGFRKTEEPPKARVIAPPKPTPKPKRKPSAPPPQSSNDDLPSLSDAAAPSTPPAVKPTEKQKPKPKPLAKPTKPEQPAEPASRPAPPAAYMSKVKAAFSLRWSDEVTPKLNEFQSGSLSAVFHIDAQGKVIDFAVSDNTSNAAFAQFCEQFVRSTEFDPPPTRSLKDGTLEIPFTFKVY
jgi:periplasmic protein TonB